MKRVRLSTSLLLMAIVGLTMALVVERRHSGRRIAELEARVVELNAQVKPAWQRLAEARRASESALDRSNYLFDESEAHTTEP